MKHFPKIFNQSISKFYIVTAAVGVIFGLVITIFCVDVYDKLSSSIMKSGERNHLIVNKRVGVMNMLALSDNSFTKDDIEDLKKQPFIEDVGEIISTSSRIWAFRDQEPLKFKTDIFFEALDDKFLDKRPREWRWSEGDEFVPVMINADFLNLYNFAFAKTQNLPQFTKETVGKFTVLLEVHGNGKTQLFKTRIIDVSDRIPSLIAPQKFVKYVNDNFGKADEGKYSRVLLKVDNPSDPDLINYLQVNDIVANEDILSSGKSKTILAKVLAAEISLAFIIVFLASIIVIIAFELMISNAKSDIELLKNLGFHSKELMAFFAKKFNVLLFIQLIFTLVINLAIGYGIKMYLESIGYEDISILSLVSIAVFVGVGALYYLFFKWRIGSVLRK